MKSPGPAVLAPSDSAHLPQDVCCLVFRHLAASLEPHDGLRGPGVVAADIVRAGLACRDMYDASREGLEALAASVPVVVGAWPLPPGDPTGGIDWALWDRLLRLRNHTLSHSNLQNSNNHNGKYHNHHGHDHHHHHYQDKRAMAFKANCDGASNNATTTTTTGRCSTSLITTTAPFSEVELREALRKLSLSAPANATPSELQGALRRHFGLSAGEPCPVPARLWVALQQERMYTGPGRLSLLVVAVLRDMVEAGIEVAKHALAAPNLADVRRDLCDVYGSTAGLLAAHRACLPALAEARRVFAEAKRAEREARLAERRAVAAAPTGPDDGMWQQGTLGGGRARRHPPDAVGDLLTARRVAHATYGHAACVCGSPAATQCCMALCCKCCRTYRTRACPRHGE